MTKANTEALRLGEVWARGMFADLLPKAFSAPLNKTK